LPVRKELLPRAITAIRYTTTRRADLYCYCIGMHRNGIVCRSHSISSRQYNDDTLTVLRSTETHASRRGGHELDLTATPTGRPKRTRPLSVFCPFGSACPSPFLNGSAGRPTRRPNFRPHFLVFKIKKARVHRSCQRPCHPGRVRAGDMPAADKHMPAHKMRLKSTTPARPWSCQDTKNTWRSWP
jgi:hypothetical protein